MTQQPATESEVQQIRVIKNGPYQLSEDIRLVDHLGIEIDAPGDRM